MTEMPLLAILYHQCTQLPLTSLPPAQPHWQILRYNRAKGLSSFLSNAVFRCFLVSHSNARVLRNLETHREISASCIEKNFLAFSRINSVGRCLIVWSMMEVVGQENR